MVCSWEKPGVPTPKPVPAPVAARTDAALEQDTVAVDDAAAPGMHICVVRTQIHSRAYLVGVNYEENECYKPGHLAPNCGLLRTLLLVAVSDLSPSSSFSPSLPCTVTAVPSSDAFAAALTAAFGGAGGSPFAVVVGSDAPAAAAQSTEAPAAPATAGIALTPCTDA
jgi:hypothetical protein